MNVSGYVRNSNGDPLAGAIVQDNQGNGTQTDENGFYSMTTVDGAELVASYFTTTSNMKLANQTEINFTLPVLTTDEVNVIGLRPLPDLLSLILFCTLAYVIFYGLWKIKLT